VRIGTIPWSSSRAIAAVDALYMVGEEVAPELRLDFSTTRLSAA
jgi:hypothetical protein